MKAADKLLVAFGVGFFVGGWWTRHPELAIGGLVILFAYAVIHVITEGFPE